MVAFGPEERDMVNDRGQRGKEVLPPFITVWTIPDHIAGMKDKGRLVLIKIGYHLPVNIRVGNQTLNQPLWILLHRSIKTFSINNLKYSLSTPDLNVGLSGMLIRVWI